ncbi:hypothetical protein PO909_007289 [Leuciscus waleckii]
MSKGSLIGNVAQDLGLDLKRLRAGRARIVTGESTQYAELRTDKGVLVVSERIDREQLCGDITPCSFSFEIILENPMELHQVTVEITDVNDNSPVFENNKISFEISESAALGARFLLDRAIDHDVGRNGLQSYSLEPTDNFVLKFQNLPDGNKAVEMVLQTPLDREKQDHISLLLTAFDGGEPQMSGTMKILITVLDANDNAPVCSQSVYKTSIAENSPKGTVLTTVSASDADQGSNGRISFSISRSTVLKVSATDGDMGSNGEVTYSFSQSSESSSGLFTIDSSTGEITVNGPLDFEKSKKYELYVEATDKGGLSDTSKVHIEITDINDNAPIISVISFSSPVPENSAPETVIAMLNVKDLDSGKNGIVKCFIPHNLPFKIKSSTPNFYSLVTDELLDREMISNASVKIIIQDQNDNAPQVLYPVQSGVSVVAEIVPRSADVGYLVTKVVAVDVDSGQNAWLSYKLQKATDRALFEVGLQNGEIRTSNASVKIIIQDQNDNAPQVLYPVQSGVSVVAEIVPRSADVGYLVTKVVAVDVDSGQNAWLSYKLQKATDRALFEVGLQNGEIRTVRQVTDKDAVKQRLTVVVEDNGQPSRSATVNVNVAVADTTVNVNVAVADSFPEVLSEFTDFTHDKEYNDNLTFYLVLALAVVSFLFIVSIIAILSVKCYRWRRERMFYKSGANLPVIPYYPPLYADVGGTGTLQHVYNYEVCGTTDSRKSDLKFLRPSSQSVLNVDLSGTRTVPKQNRNTEEPDVSAEVRSLAHTIFGHLIYTYTFLNIITIDQARAGPRHRRYRQMLGAPLIHRGARMSERVIFFFFFFTFFFLNI